MVVNTLPLSGRQIIHRQRGRARVWRGSARKSGRTDSYRAGMPWFFGWSPHTWGGAAGRACQQDDVL